MAAKRRAEQSITIPAVINPKRRAAGEKCLETFAKNYFPDLFYLGLSQIHYDIIDDFQELCNKPARRAEAAPRGTGKTTWSEVAIIWAVCYRKKTFVVLLSATGEDAQARLADVKNEFEFNDLLFEDFPEISAPIRALEGSAVRGRKQVHENRNTKIEWGVNEVVFPEIEINGVLSAASGIIITCRGLNAAVRGLKRGSLRPDMVIIDDIETRESAESATQTAKIKRVITRDIGQLKGAAKSISMLMLCTLISWDCLAAQFTDPDQNPVWRGRRMRALIEKPTRDDLWQEYIDLRQKSFRTKNNSELGDKFYGKNRKEMDQGARVAWDDNFDPDAGEISALQAIYNVISDDGEDAFLTELQNDPPKPADETTPSITANLVRSRVNNMEEGIIPAACDTFVASIDVHARYLYWMAVAGRKGGSIYGVEYGVENIFGPKDINAGDPNDPNQKALEMAMANSLRSLRDRLNSTWMDTEKNTRHLDLCLVDAGWKTNVVVKFCQEDPMRYKPTIGRGSKPGQVKFRQPDTAGHNVRLGDHWFFKYNDRWHDWLLLVDHDYWVEYMHDRFRTGPSQDGAFTLWGDSPKKHIALSKHIVAVRMEEKVTDKGIVRKMVYSRGPDHWESCAYYCTVAANMLGVSVNPSVGRTYNILKKKRQPGEGWAESIKKLRGQ